MYLPPRGRYRSGGQKVMERGIVSQKTPATIQELQARVAAAFGRNPLCREVRFDIVGTPKTRSGANWTVSMSAIPSDAIWEASELVADIQDAYILAA